MFLDYIKRVLLKKRWKRKNKDNGTILGRYPINLAKVSIGKMSYGMINIKDFDNSNSSLTIENFCSIAPEVVFLLDGEHPYDSISTYPFNVRLELGDENDTTKGNIIVDDDVWIGYRASILSGVHIGQGAVIAAGAVVTKDVPPYAIVGGVPAKVIKYRFSHDVIDVLMAIDFSRLTKDLIAAHIDDLYKPLDGLTASQVEEAIAWMPKKLSRS